MILGAISMHFIRHHRGRQPREGGPQWIAGATVHSPATGATEAFLAYRCDARDAGTLNPWLQALFAGTGHIVTDGWRAYSSLCDRFPAFSHFVVIHQHEFVNAAGYHTNAIERCWQSMKKGVLKNGIEFSI